jgi:hypothetical protein
MVFRPHFVVQFSNLEVIVTKQTRGTIMNFDDIVSIAPPHIQPEQLVDIGSINQLTGRFRKKERRATNYKRRSSRSHDLIVKNIALESRLKALVWSKKLSVVQLLVVRVANNLQQLGNVNNADTQECRRKLHYLRMMGQMCIHQRGHHLLIDSQLMDIEDALYNQPIYHITKRYSRLADFQNDDHCERHTNFRIDEMRYLIELFGVDEEYIRVSRPNNQADLRFHQSPLESACPLGRF